MASSTEETPKNFPGGPNFTQRQWSEEVAIARAQSGEPIDNRDPSYVFSNGRRFLDPNRPL